jgi:hypothetical protein
MLLCCSSRRCSQTAVFGIRSKPTVTRHQWSPISHFTYETRPRLCMHNGHAERGGGCGDGLQRGGQGGGGAGGRPAAGRFIASPAASARLPGAGGGGGGDPGGMAKPPRTKSTHAVRCGACDTSTRRRRTAAGVPCSPGERQSLRVKLRRAERFASLIPRVLSAVNDTFCHLVDRDTQSRALALSLLDTRQSDRSTQKPLP